MNNFFVYLIIIYSFTYHHRMGHNQNSWILCAMCILLSVIIIVLCPVVISINLELRSLVWLNFHVWCATAGYSSHASGFSTLLWLSKEQQYSKSLWVTFLQGAQIYMVCSTWVCHWPSNCFGSWSLNSLTSTCTSLSGISVFVFFFYHPTGLLVICISHILFAKMFCNCFSYYYILFIHLVSNIWIFV